MNSSPNMARYTLLLKPKQQHKPKNHAEKRTAAKENETTEGKGRHHGLAVAATTACGASWLVCAHRFSNAAFCAFFWFVEFALDLPSWAYWASFATSLDLVWPQFSYFLLTFV